MVIRQSESCLPGHVATWAEGIQAIHKSVYILSFGFFSNCSEKQLSSRFCLDLDWHCFVSNCSWTRNHHHFHHLISPYFIIFEESQYLVQPWNKSKLFCFPNRHNFVKSCWILPTFCLDLLPFFGTNLRNENLCIESWYRLAVTHMLLFTRIHNHAYWTYSWYYI